MHLQSNVVLPIETYSFFAVHVDVAVVGCLSSLLTPSSVNERHHHDRNHCFSLKSLKSCIVNNVFRRFLITNTASTPIV